jgi:hypothetical protein
VTRPWRRQTKVVHTPRVTRMGPYTPEYTNDGGTDAPLTDRDSRFVAFFVLGLLAAGAVVGVAWYLLAR